MNPQYLFMGTADTLLETFWFLADSNKCLPDTNKFEYNDGQQMSGKQ